MRQSFAAFLALVLLCLLVPQAAMAAGRSYYVDSVSGNDNNNGLTTVGAWKSLSKLNNITFSPGDKIYLKAGSVWNNAFLKPSGSGTPSAPVVIDQYGTGPRPVIHTNGKAAAAISLLYVEGWEIRNLELTNQGGTVGRYRRGLYVETGEADTRTYFRFQNLYIHDINGDLNDHQNGGIIMRGYSQGGKRAEFHDVIVEHCTIRRADRNGIRISNENSRGSTGIILRSNMVDTIGGDGIVTVGTSRALIEHNVAKDCFYQYKQMPNVACVAIWTYKSDDTLVQYNEAYLTHSTRDGEGFDSDYNCTNSVFQYNYSHDNEGGFMLVCNNPSSPSNFNTGTIVRYNISQNDQNSGIMLSGNPTHTKIYNNTIYIGEGLATNPVNTYNWNGGWADQVYFSNNIFYNLGSGAYKLGGVTNYQFDHNVFYGRHPASEPEDAYKITADPKLRAPGSGRLGIDTLGGYRLMEGSPCIGSGRAMEENGGYDYFGTPLEDGKRDIGAAEYVRGFFYPSVNGDAVSKVWVTDAEGREAQGLRPGRLTVRTEIEPVMLEGTTYENTVLAAALYDGAGRLVQISYTGEQVKELVIEIPEDCGEYWMTLFLWDSITGMRPLDIPVTILAEI